MTLGVSHDATRRVTFLKKASFDGGLNGLDTFTLGNAAFLGGNEVANFELFP